MLKRVNSLWVGDRLGYLEQVCLVSAAAVGHPVTLYSYTPDRLKGVPPGIELRDAREVMPEERVVKYAGHKLVCAWAQISSDTNCLRKIGAIGSMRMYT